MKRTICPIPIENMPRNIHKLLTKKDYAYALFHPGGFQKGIFDMIHLNIDYPQWHNIIMNANDGTDMNIVVYTVTGWAVKPINYIWDQLMKEYFLCFNYVEKNKEKFWPGISDYDSDDSDDIDLEKLLKDTSLDPSIDQVIDDALTSVANMIGKSIRRTIEQNGDQPSSNIKT